MTSAPNASRPATGDRKPRVRSTIRSDDRKSTDIDVDKEIISRRSWNRERDDQVENDKIKAEQGDNLPLLKGS